MREYTENLEKLVGEILGLAHTLKTIAGGFEGGSYVLEKGIPYTSGPQWLSDYLLNERWVIAVAGTLGKTTTASMVTWILEYAKLNPGFLIGGIPKNFGVNTDAIIPNAQE